jgi:2-keto-4-pentenoate hydratase/2-oxohepta-3-ene-1,7-dioic acid hydratase in catechol pathway
MKVITYEYHGVIGVGALSDDGLYISPFALSSEVRALGLLAIVEADAAKVPLKTMGDSISLREVKVLAPIPRPRRNIICVGKNYFAHVKEIANRGFDTTGGRGEAPEFPIIFSKFPDCVIGNEDEIIHNTKVTSQLDYEAELAVIIGLPGRGVEKSDAMNHVWGYTLINDVSARDIQGRHKQWLLGKSQDTFCPMGPIAVSKDLIDLSDTEINCWVNGELRQSGNTASMIFDIPTLIETISAGISLYPGDIIATGTPAGVGAGFNPPRFLRHNDLVEIQLIEIGTLRNRVNAISGFR